MTVGSCLGAVLVLAWASTSILPGLYVVWAAIGLVWATVVYDPAFAIITVWFGRKRVRALTAVTLMAGFASTFSAALRLVGGSPGMAYRAGVPRGHPAVGTIPRMHSFFAVGQKTWACILTAGTLSGAKLLAPGSRA